MVSYETVRRWVNHFGPKIAADLRKRRPEPHTTWHLDEVYLKIDGRMVYLWRAVDAEGEVLDVLVQSRRNKRAALKLMRKLLKKYGVVPEKLVTDDYDRMQPQPVILESQDVINAVDGATTEPRIRINHNPTTRTQDARVQERWIRLKISLIACSSSQYLQRQTSSHLSKNPPSLSRVGDEHLACGRRGRLKICKTQVSRVLHSLM
jgi:transposase-like protein